MGHQHDWQPGMDDVLLTCEDCVLIVNRRARDRLEALEALARRFAALRGPCGQPTCVYEYERRLRPAGPWHHLPGCPIADARALLGLAPDEAPSPSSA